VIRGGKLVALTSPREARAGLDGRVFEGDVAPEQLDELRRTRRITHAVLVEGRNRVRVFEPNATPLPGFEPVPATLEDAYFLLMRDDMPEVSAA
jgi:hypothetical protein